MRRLKKAAFPVLMLALTLVAIEGMARLAWYVIHDEAYGRERLPLTTAETPQNRGGAERFPHRIHHPYYGYAPSDPNAALNVPPSGRREGTVVIGLLGGSVAAGVGRMFEKAVHRHFRENDIALEPVVLRLAFDGMKQPQQVMTLGYKLFLGEELDIVVNLDGHNEIGESTSNFLSDIFPSFPWAWAALVDATTHQLAWIGRIRALREEQEGVLAAGRSVWGRSAAVGLFARFRLERIENSIRMLHRQLEETETEYSLEKHGPRANYRGRGEMMEAATREWYRGSVLLAALAEQAGADYYHFLQPNQYIPDSKPLTDEERETAYLVPTPKFARTGYPELIRLGRELEQQGIGFFDLTMIFKDNRETLYIDICCHLNERGYELLAEQMVQRMAGSFVRGGPSEPSGKALAVAARPPARPRRLLIGADWNVFLDEERNRLVYEKQPCSTPEDVRAAFFLHVTPVNEGDLPPDRRRHGYDNLDFRFERDGGKDLARNRCLVTARLPDYDIAAIRTGQYDGKARIWEGEHRFEEGGR